MCYTRPIQVWAGIDFHQAAATSLFLIMVVSLSASLVFRKAKKIDWQLTVRSGDGDDAGRFPGRQVFGTSGRQLH